jgi:hypothetical protein
MEELGRHRGHVPLLCRSGDLELILTAGSVMLEVAAPAGTNT